MQKVYQRINWENEPSTKSPINDDNLNKMDYALDQVDSRVVQLSGYEERTKESETNAKESEVNAKTSEINAKQSELLAQEYADEAFKGTPEGYQEFLDKVDALEIKTTKERTIKGTKHGGFRLTKMLANTVQNGTPSPNSPQSLLSTSCLETKQGYYSSAGKYEPASTRHVCSKYKYPCKSGDVIKVTSDEKCGLDIEHFVNGVFGGHLGLVLNVNSIEYTIPSGGTEFVFNVQNDNRAITPETVGNITVQINGKYLGVAKTHRKNFFSYDKASTKLVKSSARTTTIASNKPIWLEAGTYKIVMSDLNLINSSIGFLSVQMNGVSSLNTSIAYNNGVYVGKVTITDDVLLSYLYIFLASNDNDNATATFSEIMIVKDDVTDYTFEEYKETEAYFLTQYPMIKGSTLFRENGLVKAMHYAREVVFDISRIGSIDNSIGLYQFLHNMTDLEPIACTHFVKYPYQDITFNSQASALSDGQFSKRYGGTNDRIYFRYSGFKSIDDVSAYLQTNSIVILCKTNTPIIETLDTASQIALNGLETFDGVTIVEFDTRVQPLEFEAEVGTSQVGAYTLKSLNNSESNAVKIEDAIDTMLLITP